MIYDVTLETAVSMNNFKKISMHMHQSQKTQRWLPQELQQQIYFKKMVENITVPATSKVKIVSRCDQNIFHIYLFICAASGAFCLRQNAQRAALRVANQATSGKVKL